MSNNNDAAIALLEKHFDIALAAPDGIKKLRELILSLAMQGKLVPQDPNDQPASELLKEIEAEKKRLVKEGKIKQSKPLLEIKPDELPYKLPKSWEWIRLGSVGETNIGLTYAPSDISDTGTPVLRSNNIQNGKLDLTDLKRVNKGIKENVLVQQGDLLICARNGSKALVGKTAVITDLSESMAFGAFMAIFRSRINGYLLYFINSPLFRQMIDEVNTMTINQITQNNLKSTIFPLPPLAEQRRIVAKIDELMARCDELEKLRSDRDHKQITVHTAALNRLLIAKQQSEFNTAWQFITQHFSELYLVKENIAELRKAILQLAVMGKLVPQDPKDQPASELLKKIEAEKERLVKEGKIKSQTPLPDIRKMPYVLPIGWQWVRFEDIVEISNGVTKGRKLNDKEIVVLPYLRVANVQRGYLDLDVIKDIEIAKDEIERFELKKRDLLITEGGDWDKVGRTAIWNNEIPHCIHQNHIFKARRLLAEQNEQWLEKYLNSSVARAYFANASKQTTNLASINKTQLRGCPIPIPPLTEQHRIVVKIDQLMALCNNLEKQIDHANSKQTNLLNAVMTKI